MNVTTGSTQVLAVAAEPHGFVSAGSHDKQPAVWTTTDGRLWTTIGQAITALGPVPFAELSADGGASWRQVRFSPPGPGTATTALTAYAGGFAAAGRYGVPGRQSIVTWTSASGTNWTPALVGELGAGSGAISSLTSSGSAVTAIGSAVTAQARRFLLLALTPS